MDDEEGLFVEQDEKKKKKKKEEEDGESLFVEQDEVVHPVPASDRQNKGIHSIPLTEEYGSSIQLEELHSNNVPQVDVASAILSVSLDFHKSIIRDLLSEDALLVLGRGLGITVITANLLYALDVAGTRRNQAGERIAKENLVLLIGADENENRRITEELWELSEMSPSSSCSRGLNLINTETSSFKLRTEQYLQGGVFSVTSRILIVDMLSNAIDCSRITGIVVLHAHRITETSTEAFILRVFRDRNKRGFIKGLSENPEAFSSAGLSPLATKMKLLQSRRVILWPRFHLEVTAALTGDINPDRHQHQNEVIEISVELSDSMKQMQSAIMECMEACISQVKRISAQLDTENWNLDVALTRDIVTMMRLQLDPIWHRISWRTKQVIRDLSILKQLLSGLLVLDSIGFYESLERILIGDAPDREQPTERSPWLAMDAAHSLFEVARHRVYGERKNRSQTPSEPPQNDHRIEELPKWYHLANILEEIGADKAARGHDAHGLILVMASSRRTCRELRRYLKLLKIGDQTYDAQTYLQRRVGEHLYWKGRMNSIRKGLQEDSRNILDSMPPVPEVRANGRGQPPTKRRRMRGGSMSASTARSRGVQDDEIPINDDQQDIEALKSLQNDENQEDHIFDDDAVVELVSEYSSFEVLDNGTLIVFEDFDVERNDRILEELQPSYVIMYEPDPTFLRQIEVQRATHPEKRLRAYFMYYAESVEEQLYLSDVRREKDAFTKLIRERANMPIYLDTDEQDASQNSILKLVSTRIAGGGLRTTATTEPPRVVVDIREFRSSLAWLLYSQNIQVVPVTLTVGDYIISPKICVERKSIRDLTGSLRDGRLYDQCEAMFRHYELPTLLIEFEESKSFSLEPFSDTPGGSASAETEKSLQESIQRKLAVLLLSFPKLKVIWSSSPHQSAAIFADLKSNQEEPDPELCASYGLISRDEEVKVYNDAAIDMLRAIPGVNHKNYAALINDVPNIKSLCSMSEEAIAKIIGRESAREIYKFISRTFADG
jgi:DNA excision repair protein ERCC-4